MPDDERLQELASPPARRADCLRGRRFTGPSVRVIQLKQSPQPVKSRNRGPNTAIAAYHDDVGLAILTGLHENKLTAPDDVVVIGTDGGAAGDLRVSFLKLNLARP
jgi:hypothetical protein